MTYNEYKMKHNMKYSESLAIKFTNLTKRQKETLQQMFAYMQKCTAAGANRRISFFWDAGWGMESKVLLSDAPEHCTVPLDIETDNEVFFDLSEGTITNTKIERITNET